MPAVFQQAEIRFEYPENWTVDELDEGEVVVSSPQTAFWHLTKHSPEIDPELLFDEALAALRSEYKEIEVEPAHDLLEGRDLAGFDVSFLCLDLINTCSLRGYQTPSATFLWIFQAEDHDFNQVAPVFRAMLASMLRNLA